MKVQHVSTWNWEDARDLLAIDLLAPLRLQDLVVRGMVERGRGVIVNVASMAGKRAAARCRVLRRVEGRARDGVRDRARGSRAARRPRRHRLSRAR